jgi:hypothetical protein
MKLALECGKTRKGDEIYGHAWFVGDTEMSFSSSSFVGKCSHFESK